MDFAEELWRIISNYLGALDLNWQAQLVVLLFCAAYLLVLAGLKEDDSRATLASWVRRGTYANRYQALLLFLLRALDRMFLSASEDESLPARSTTRAWPFRQFRILLVFAFLYPSISFFLTEIAGIDGLIGDRLTFNPLRNEAPFWSNILNFIWLTITIGTLLGLRLVEWFPLRAALISGILLVSIVAYPYATNTPLLYARDTYVYGSFSLLMAVCAASSLYLLRDELFLVVASACVALLGLGLAREILGLDQADFRFVSHYVANRNPEFTRLDAILMFLRERLWPLATLAIVLPIAGVLKYLNLKFEGSRLFHVVVFLLLVMALCLFVANGFGAPEHVVMLCALPLVNAVFDHFSLGATRFFLRIGVRRIGWRTLIWGVVDLTIGTVAFLTLVLVTIVVLHGLNYLSPSQIFAFETFSLNSDGNVFTVVASDPASHIWLFVTLFSTMVPTLLHASLALFAVGPALLPRTVRSGLGTLVETSEKHYYKRLISSGALSIWVVISLMVPILATSEAFHLFFEAGGLMWLLDTFEFFYRALPADPTLRPR